MRLAAAAQGIANVARRAACIAALGSQAVAAQDVARCGDAGSFNDAVAALTARGWQVATDAQSLQTHVDALAWTLLIPYLTDSGGEPIETLLDLQRRAVPGLLAKRDTETTRARVLIRGADAMTLTQTATLPGRTERTCRAALSAGDGNVDTSRAPGAPALQETVTILPEEKAP